MRVATDNQGFAARVATGNLLLFGQATRAAATFMAAVGRP